MIYLLIIMLLLILELAYFRIANNFNIIDKPNERSSHSTIVLRGGGIIFLLGMWVWSLIFGFQYPWFVASVTLIAGVSFIDDIKRLSDSVRLVVQFIAMGLMFYEIGILQWSFWWMVLIGLIICVGATNVINFMDGVNGITAGYSLAVLISLALLAHFIPFIEKSYLIVAIQSVLVFSLFNFHPRGKAKCFAGDVGSIGIAFIMLFAIGKLIITTQDVTWLILLLVYGIDGCLTIFHRILLHENLGKAHRKHVYQLMANELKMSHPLVSTIYMMLQFVISLGFIFVCPNTVLAHWIYFVVFIIILSTAYILFKKKYYHLHEEYLASIGK